MSKTINGMSYQVAIAELQKPFPESAFSTLDYSNHKYLPVDQVIKRFDEVLGPFCYDYTCSEINLFQNGTQQNIVLIGKITLKNDDGDILTSRSCAGAANIIYPKETPETPTKVSNNAETASKDAFKRCAKLFGVGTEQLKEARDSKKKNKNSRNSNNEEKISATIISAFSFKNNTYTASVKVHNKEKVLVIFKEAQEKINKIITMQQFTTIYSPGKILTFSGYFKTYNNTEQVIMTNVSSKDEQ